MKMRCTVQGVPAVSRAMLLYWLQDIHPSQHDLPDWTLVVVGGCYYPAVLQPMHVCGLVRVMLALSASTAISKEGQGALGG